MDPCSVLPRCEGVCEKDFRARTRGCMLTTMGNLTSEKVGALVLGL